MPPAWVDTLTAAVGRLGLQDKKPAPSPWRSPLGASLGPVDLASGPAWRLQPRPEPAAPQSFLLPRLHAVLSRGVAAPRRAFGL